MSNYQTKNITHNTKQTKFILQNHNGPCPLLALVNVLLLRGDICIETSLIDFATLSIILADFLIQMASEPSAELALHLQDALEILPSLEKGFDINVHFSSAESFEFSSGLSIFDVVRVRLWHGWVVDEKDIQQYDLIVKKLKSYNALVDCVVRGEAAASTAQTSTFVEANMQRDELVSQGVICREFLDSTSSQLTRAGLDEITQKLAEDQPGILFRNNHFLTLIKRDGVLYSLVTDVGYLESQVVWESLDTLTGASSFFDENFQQLDLNSEFLPIGDNIDGLEGEDASLALARRLQAQEERDQESRLRAVQSDFNPLEGSDSVPASRLFGRGSTNTSSSSLLKKDKPCLLM
jgi:hypothetical protein